LSAVFVLPVISRQGAAKNLDKVDASWQISRDFHADSLLANLWLVPDFHDALLIGSP
jgi:hypothetical protein